MSELKPRIHDKTSDLDYVLAGDYYVIVFWGLCIIGLSVDKVPSM